MNRKIKILIENKKLSELKMFLLENEKYKRNSDLKEILGLIELSLGNFNESLNYFDKENSANFYSFVYDELRLSYIPKYNTLLEKIRNNQTIQEEEVYLEKFLPNVELYHLIALYYLKNRKHNKAKEYINKGLSIDSSNFSLINLQKGIKKSTSKSRWIMLIGFFICLVAVINSTYNKHFEIIKNENNKIKSELNFKTDENKFLNATITNIKKNESNLKNSNLLINDFSEREIYLKAIKFRKSKNYTKAREYFVYVLDREKNSVYSREALFWHARTLEDSGKNDEALKNYRLYLDKYINTDIYVKETISRIKKITLK
ncbi:MAG: hypothetical protein KA157_08530 [Aliarcobacter sp.]|nr:hypothetical protein [Aliarcobacter sp.]